MDKLAVTSSVDEQASCHTHTVTNCFIQWWWTSNIYIPPWGVGWGGSF